MQAQITIKGTTALGFTIKVTVPIAWCSQFNVEAPKLAGKYLYRGWGEAESDKATSRTVQVWYERDLEAHIDKLRQEIAAAKKHLAESHTIDREILIDLE